MYRLKGPESPLKELKRMYGADPFVLRLPGHIFTTQGAVN
jgi:hypothetical protein